jgi:hypothetical protein
MDQHEADAEVGRLIRVTGWRWLEIFHDGGEWWAKAGERATARHKSPAEALRALLEGGQHDAG